MVDTTFLVDLARGDPGARAVAEAAEGGSEAMRVPAPAIAKFWEGVERSRRPPRDRAGLEAFLLGLPSVALEEADGVLAARLLAEAVKSGVPLDAFDAMVAAIAVRADETLLTRNVRDLERVPDLRIRTY